jgi:DNA polymerase-3 subunit epsilon
MWRLWRRLQTLEQRRKGLLEQAPAGAYRDYLATPFADPKCDFRQITYTALDFETTGLDPNQDELLSFGIVDMVGMSINLSTAQHEIIMPEGAIPEESAVIHEIMDDQAAEGINLAHAVELLLSRLAGKVLIAHYAKLELGFLNAACQKLYGCEFLIPTVDTLMLGHRWIEQRNLYLQQSDLRLTSLRTRFNLPRYKAHNALTDALSTAELFLALTVQRTREREVAIKQFLLPV